MKQTHDTLTYRLAQMLIKLNQGEKLIPQNLADEFGVSLRTIQRDLGERFAYLPLQKQDQGYVLEPTFLGKLSIKDVQRFASLAGINGLFPALSNDFLRDIFDQNIQSALLVKGHHYEDLSGKQNIFKQLEQAIVAKQSVAFEYQRSEGVTHYEGVCPYKLINHKGIWYLAALHNQKMKTFGFTKLSALHRTEQHFPHDPALEKMVEEDDGIWFGEDKREVVLKVAKEVAGYFKRRKLIANQVIEKELEDGGVLISTKVVHANQVLPIVRYWMPHIRIISPESLQVELLESVRQFVK